MTEPFRVDAPGFDGVRVIIPRGEVDAATREALTAHLVASAGWLIVVDLARVTFMDSSGLGALHGAWAGRSRMVATSS
jgi:anti-anti-sigma factor